MYTQGVEQTPARNWDWLTGILLFLLLQVSAARLVTTNWAPYLYFAETLAGFGVILGLALGASRFRRSTAVWLALTYTLMVLPWQMAGAATAKLLLDRLKEVRSEYPRLAVTRTCGPIQASSSTVSRVGSIISICPHSMRDSSRSSRVRTASTVKPGNRSTNGLRGCAGPIHSSLWYPW